MPGDLNDAELTGFGYGTDPLDRTFSVDYGAIYDTVATPYRKRAEPYQPINQEPMGRDYQRISTGYTNNYPYGGPLNALAGAENPYYLNDGVVTAVGPYGRGAIQNPYGSDTHIQVVGPSMSIPKVSGPPLLTSAYPVNMPVSNYGRPSITERFGNVADVVSSVTSDTTAVYVFIFMIIVMIVVISLQSYNFGCEKAEMYKLFKSMLETKK